VTARPFPPGPRGRPLVGNLPEFGGDMLAFVERCRRDYGDVVGLKLAHWPTYLVHHPDLVEELLIHRHKDYSKHHAFFWSNVEAIFGRGLLTNEGDDWLRQRRLIQPAFQPERVARYAEIMVDRTERMLAGWRPGELKDVRKEMMALTFQIVAETLFGADVRDDVAEVAAAFNVGIEEIAVRFRRPIRFPDWVPVPSNLRYRRAVRRMDELILRIIRERREKGFEERDDLLSRMLRARDEAGAMDEAQLRDEVMTMLLAGHETTALGLTWTWYLLSKHPEVDRRLHEQVRDTLGDRAPEPADMTRLHYAELVFREGLRLYPPAYGFGREAIVEGELGGWPVPAGTTLIIFSWLLHRDPRWWDDPARFDPDRWDSDLEERLPRLAYMPFGAGPRVCIGQRFAIAEGVLILSAIARRFRLEWLADPVPFTSITLRPTGDLRARLLAR
jgi:cytochrome P450